MRTFIRRPLFALVGLLLSIAASAHAAPVTIPEPVAPPLDGVGQGLCVASAISESPSVDFGFLNRDNYNAGINTFIEAHVDDRVEGTISTALDLSNNNASGTQLSYGDFIDAQLPQCQTGGCDFFVNDDATSFGARLRGYLNITAELANQPMHFGLYADDAISLTIFDKSANIYPVMIRPPQIGAATWRLTETVTFAQPGLYPVELLYAEFVEHAALEMSYFIGDFEDFERPANTAPVVPLDDAGFTLFPATFFYQALSGANAFQDPAQCQQCNRQFVNLAGNNGCPGSYYCNDAALCAPCDTALFCGPSCSPCGAASPFCLNLNGENQCVECRDDDDCRPGYQCEPETNTCTECVVDADCERGEICQDQTCVTCASSDACAGNSCNCCPNGQNGQPMQCVAVDEGGPPVCVECTTDADCPDGVCDALTGHCVEALAANQRTDCCGDDCVACPADYPFCLPGPLGTACAQCRWDTDCADGAFCMSGQCQPCTEDKHCGTRCTSCGGDTPFCLDGQTADRSFCVGCTDDAQCNGGTCNPGTNECDPVCMLSCGPEAPYCQGDQCVECIADTQCPCGGTCDPDTNACTSSCKANVDCLGNEHCRWDEAGVARECALGPMPGSAACGGTLAEGCNARAGRPGASAGMWLAMLALLALLGRRRGHHHGARQQRRSSP